MRANYIPLPLQLTAEQEELMSMYNLFPFVSLLMRWQPVIWISLKKLKTEQENC